jgi:hypothetical protein
VSEAEITETDTSSGNITDADNNNNDDRCTNDIGIAKTHDIL